MRLRLSALGAGAEWAIVVVLALSLGFTLKAASTPASNETELTGSGRAEAFWMPFTNYHFPLNDFESVNDIADYAHVIVRGRILTVQEAFFVPYEVVDATERMPILVATVAVDEVLKGEVESRTSGALELALDPAWPDWEESLASSIPRDEHLFFLVNEAQQKRELGYEALDPVNSPYRYWRPNRDQAVLWNDGGMVAINESQRGRYPLPVADMEYAGLLAALRSHLQTEEAPADIH